jgi:hypothetical protein
MSYLKTLDLVSRGNVARMLGQYDIAAEAFAKAAKMYWTRSSFDDVAINVKKAAECLLNEQRTEDAYDGLRRTTIMLVRVGAVNGAQILVTELNHVKEREPEVYRPLCDGLSCYVRQEIDRFYASC